MADESEGDVHVDGTREFISQWTTEVLRDFLQGGDSSLEIVELLFYGCSTIPSKI